MTKVSKANGCNSFGNARLSQPIEKALVDDYDYLLHGLEFHKSGWPTPEHYRKASEMQASSRMNADSRSPHFPIESLSFPCAISQPLAANRGKRR